MNISIMISLIRLITEWFDFFVHCGTATSMVVISNSSNKDKLLNTLGLDVLHGSYRLIWEPLKCAFLIFIFQSKSPTLNGVIRWPDHLKQCCTLHFVFVSFSSFWLDFFKMLVSFHVKTSQQTNISSECIFHFQSPKQSQLNHSANTITIRQYPTRHWLL